jgi:AcrR family transcriptional regulator
VTGRVGVGSVGGSGDGARAPARRARRARLDPETRRAQLVGSACRLLEQRGVGTMSVEDVADAAGVSRSLVYAYFGDRDGLVAEVYLRVLEQLDEALVPQRATALPRDQATMSQVIEGCMRFADEHPAAWRLIVTDSVRRHPMVVQARAERVAQLVASRSDGSCQPLVADAILGLLEAGVLHWVEHARDELTAGQAARLLAAILWSGLRNLSGA